MLLKITHQTDLTYTDLISESVMELRVAPRQEEDQHRLSFNLAIGPPASVNSYFDWLGNTVHAFSINALHRQIRIVATSVLETDRQQMQPQFLSDAWPIEAGAGDGMWDYLQLSSDGTSPIVECAALRELVGTFNVQPGTSLGELAMRMLELINEKFEYEKGVTTSASPITEILEHRKGVCQDFSHLMIAMARSLKIPARYVSGLVHPDAQRFRGYTQTHAWCEFYFPSMGWIGLDPTNKCVIGPNFVKVGVGRDYRDVPPNKGLYRGKAKESIDVAVSTEELDFIPAALAAERFEPLAVPTYPQGYTAHAAIATQQQEHSQQQQQQSQQ
jgi:transglutaminase-like putative cysteine protease